MNEFVNVPLCWHWFGVSLSVGLAISTFLLARVLIFSRLKKCPKFLGRDSNFDFELIIFLALMSFCIAIELLLVIGSTSANQLSAQAFGAGSFFFIFAIAMIPFGFSRPIAGWLDGWFNYRSSNAAE